MQSTQTPTLVPLAWAANGTKNAIPEASQIGITPGAASLNDGFPPLTMTPIAAGGVPPSGADFNGVLNLITQTIRWKHAGGPIAWSSTFAADANVGGYPKGALLARADLTGWWISTAENNTTNPDATDGSAAGWVPGFNYGTTSVTGLTNSDVTLAPLLAAKSRIVLTGTLTGSINLILPAWVKEWQVVNNTTGAFTVVAKTASGTGVALPRGQTSITGDGTNILQPAANIAAGTTTTQAAQLGQVAGIVGSVRNLQMNVIAASVSATMTADEIVVETALGGVRSCMYGFAGAINLTTVGAGGMDTGTAPTSGFVAIYAILNPSTGSWKLLATNATSGAAPSIYGGANMPAGYTSSALVSVWPTNGSGQLVVGLQIDRDIAIPLVQVFSGPSQQASYTPLSVSSAIPANARSISGIFQVGSTAASNCVFSVAGTAGGVGAQNTGMSVPSNTVVQGAYSRVPLATPQTLYYTATAASGTMSSYLGISGYSI